MKHLNDAELVALLDGQLPDARVHHAQECAACRTKADGLLRTLADVMTDAAPPEPSPLFWAHFTARVAEAVRDEPPGGATSSPLSWLRRPAVTWALGVSAALLIVVLIAWRATLHAPAPGSAPSQMSAWTAPHVADQTDAAPSEAAARTDDLERDEAWGVVRSAAEGLAWDEAHEAGISPHPGSAESVALELSGDERVELARLIEETLKRSGA